MEERVVVAVLATAGAERAELEAELPPDARVADLVAACAGRLHADGGTAYSRRLGRPLPLEAPLADADLLDGDELVLAREAPPAEREPVTALELVVVGGPDAGRRFPLGAGERVVGRDPSCDVAVDDPALSGRHVRLVVGAATAVVSDAGSRNGTAVEGESLRAGEEATLEPGAWVQAGRTVLAVEPAAPATASSAQPGREPATLVFNRPPRVVRPVPARRLRLDAPPLDPQRARLPLVSALVPAVLGIALWLATGSAIMLVVTALSPLMALTSWLESRRSGASGFGRDARAFRERVAALAAELAEARREEARERRLASPPVAELVQRAQRRLPSLWERRPRDADFLTLRLGAARLPSSAEVELVQGGSETLRREAEAALEQGALLPPVPVTAALGELGVLGLCGDGERVAALARSLLVQAATLHSPAELVVSAALGDRLLPGLDWLKWLPHCRVDEAELERGPLGARRLVETAAGVLADRRAQPPGAPRALPVHLLVLDEEVAPERALLAELLAEGPAHGIVTLWLGGDRRTLPGECGGIVELDAATARLAFTEVARGETVTDVTADGVAVDVAARCARALAPLRDASAAASAGRVPERVALLDLLGEPQPTRAWVERRWRAGSGDLAAVVGADANGAFEVDLRRDGPHGLVAGTTGAGKSELLQTLIASLAVSHAPDRLTFLLVDYKGGAAFKECVRLPHTVGFVTDLDEHLTQRALVSLNAELRGREAVLREEDAKDLYELERRAPDRAPPSLLIVIDEFATLAKEVPDFVNGVVDVAQRGRSLGVHLLLATQRPGGVVSENIRANTNLRVALRVANVGESTDVIGVSDAARIPRGRPGRGYVRTGHSELAELQTAYVGGTTGGGGAPEAIVRELSFERRRDARNGAPEDGTGENDLRLLVRLAREAAEAQRLPAPRSPWLPPLEPIVPLDTLTAPDTGPDPLAVAVVGVVDEPARQRRVTLGLDLETEGSVLVFGTSGSGKTTLLRTLALSLAERASPEELHVYGIDAATGGLALLEPLPHCGGIVSGSDEERVRRLFALLRRTLDRRKRLFEEERVATLAEHRRGAGPTLPRVLCLLDGYASFSQTFERVAHGDLLDALPRLVADGRPLGVHFAITSDRRGAVPNALAGIVPTKIVLRMADEDDYPALGIPLRTIRGARLPAGRGFTRDSLELQCALPGRDASGEGQARTLAERAAELERRFGAADVPGIAPLPAHVPARELPAPERLFEAVLGLGDAELEPVRLSLADRHFVVAGPYRSGRSSALATLATSLAAAPRPPELHLLAPRRSPLVELAVWTSVASGADACEDAAARLAALVQDGPVPRPLVVVVDDGDELAEAPSALALETVVRRGRDLEVRVVASAERQALARAFGGFLRELRKEEHGLLLDPDLDVDGDLLGVRLPRRTNPVFPPGRGYLVERGLMELVQVAAPWA